jgi:hypothetical protein
MFNYIRNTSFKFLFILIFLLSCQTHDKSKKIAVPDTKNEMTSNALMPDYNERLQSFAAGLSPDSVFSNDTGFIHSQLLQGRFKVKLENYDTIRRDFCFPGLLHKKNEVEQFEGFEKIGDLDNDGKDDYVFVLSPLNRCEDGESYYFSNPLIERIATDSYCCHPNSIFSIGDIDEDGSDEIGEYYSSCASRYKAITIWTLRNLKWKEVETFSFVLNDEYEEFRDFKKLSKKIRKNLVSFLEIKDVDAEGNVIKEWRTVSIL